MRLTTVASIVGLSSLSLVATAPALAATVVAQANATALEVAIAGQAEDSGTVRATHDGTSQTKTGTANPPAKILTGQSLVSIGALAQDARATVVDKRGISEACAGIAGDGGSAIEIGKADTCLKRGENVNLTLTNLDLASLFAFDSDDTLAPALAPLTAATPEQLAEIRTAVDGAIQAVADQTTDLGVRADLGAVESRCRATPAGASGGSRLTDVTIDLVGPAELLGSDEKINLVTFPVTPPPNRKLLTDLDEVAKAITDALTVQLNQGLDGLADPLKTVVDQVQAQILTAVLGEIGPQLAPLEKNLLDVTLNKQVRGDRSIEVTAIDAQVLPAAQADLGASLASIAIARSECGPNARVAGTTAVPTTVNAGTGAETGTDTSSLMLTSLGLLLTLAGAAGVTVAARRRVDQP